MMFARYVLRVAGFVLVVVEMTPTSAQTRPNRPEASLIAAENAIFAAKLVHDTATIARAMANDATYTHGSGRVQTKAEYIRTVANNRLPYRAIEPIGRVVLVSGNLGVTHAMLRMVVGDRHMEDSYLAVYVHRAGRWQLLFWQTTPRVGATPASPTPQR